MTAIMSRTIKRGEVLRFRVIQDGVTVVDQDRPPSESDFDCLGSAAAGGPLGVGSYELRYTVSDTVVASGTLTVR